jgi:O-antigen/teichoic acid export membrane protein
MENFLLILTGDIARRILGFVAVAYLARTAGTDGFGMINISFAVLSYTLMASSAGLNSLGAREVARGGSEELVGQILGLRSVLALAALALTACMVMLISNHQLAVLIILFNFALIPQAFFLDWYYQGKEKMGSIVAARIFGALAYVLTIVLLIHPGGDIRWVGLCVVSGDIATALGFLVRYIRINGMPKIRIDIPRWRNLLRQSIPMATGSILGNLSINFPPLAIGYFMTNADVGIYSAASKLVFFLLMFDRVIGTLLLPASARIHERRPEEFAERLRMTMKWMIIIALSCSLGAVLVAKNIILLIYGEQYLASTVILQIGIWYFFFTLLHTVYATGLIAIGKEQLYGRIMAISASMYFITVIAGIKLLGVGGAAIGVVSSEAVTLYLMQHTLGKFTPISLPHELAKILFSAVAMGVVVFFLSALPVLLTVLAGAAVYIGLLLTTRAVTPGEIYSLVRQTA